MTQYSLKNPFAEKDPSSHMNGNIPETPSRYHEMLERGKELLELPKKGGGESRVQIQHGKGRMTVWERIKVLTDKEPHITFQNWGAQLDGAG
ncbi:uncharacterized protein METZ01_LOCUS237912, partial [marine metagenome]